MFRIIRVAAVAVLVSAAPAALAAAQSIVGPPRPGEPPRLKIETPEHFFGFRMGADNKMAHWNDMVRYYDLLGKTSGRMKVVNMGKTSEGRPFYALFISSPANLAKLEAFRRINATHRRSARRPGRLARDAHQAREGRGPAVDEHALDGDRRQPDGGRAGLRPAQPDRRRRRAGSSTTSSRS